jgi:guanylate kinase
MFYLILTGKGADQIKNKKLDYKLLTFFILPPSKEGII